jgi:GntR family transcriptional regulator/MocR family aminotransferase
MPLQVQLADQFRHLILSKRLAAGSRLPSSRKLSQTLGISRTTVVNVMDHLVSEGYLESVGRVGYFVPDDLALLHVFPKRSFTRPSRVDNSKERGPSAIPFQVGAIDARIFPHETWARHLQRAWRNPEERLLVYDDVAGWRPLREALALHLFEWRGIVCDAEQIVITGGARDSYALLARAFLKRGETAIVEDPGFPAARLMLQEAGIRLLPIPVDSDGIVTTALATAPPTQMALVTPSRQFPLGGTLPLARRAALLDWAVEKKVILIEDDFDSEYRYAGIPISPLTCLDRNETVIYAGSFSRVLPASVRLGYLVVPWRLLARLKGYLALRGSHASLLPQPALATFIESGEYAGHIRRARRIYAERLHALEAAARSAGAFRMIPVQAGLHVVAELRSFRNRSRDADRAAKRAKAEGLVVRSLSQYYCGAPHQQALVLGFAGFAPEQLVEACARLDRALRGVSLLSC